MDLAQQYTQASNPASVTDGFSNRLGFVLFVVSRTHMAADPEGGGHTRVGPFVAIQAAHWVAQKQKAREVIPPKMRECEIAGTTCEATH